MTKKTGWKRENKIPAHLQDEFVSYVSMADDFEAPDGAWQAMIEDACEWWLLDRNINMHRNDAFHVYLQLAYPDS